MVWGCPCIHFVQLCAAKQVGLVVLLQEPKQHVLSLDILTVKHEPPQQVESEDLPPAKTSRHLRHHQLSSNYSSRANDVLVT